MMIAVRSTCRRLGLDGPIDSLAERLGQRDLDHRDLDLRRGSWKHGLIPGGIP